MEGGRTRAFVVAVGTVISRLNRLSPAVRVTPCPTRISPYIHALMDVTYLLPWIYSLEEGSISLWCLESSWEPVQMLQMA